jgi:ABC-type glycerol-3-phosphate transport system substrate-binding protein
MRTFKIGKEEAKNFKKADRKRLGFNDSAEHIDIMSTEDRTVTATLENGKEYAKIKQDAAWVFLQYLTKEENAQKYLNKVKKPSALRELVGKQVEDNEIGIFASQVLTAKSWYKGIDAIATENIFNNMVNNIIEGNDKSIAEIIFLGAQQVQQTIK